MTSDRALTDELETIAELDVIHAATDIELERRALLAVEELAIRSPDGARRELLWMTVRELRPHKEPYRIALRPDQDGYLDDVVVNDVSMFRMEDMGDWWWLCCYLAGSDDRICFHITTAGRSKARVVASILETPTIDIAYEHGAEPKDITKP